MTERNSDINSFLQKIHALSSEKELDAVIEQLAPFINDLIQNDFEKLLYLLYRIDVDEQALKRLLKDHPQTDAATIISRLIVKRQVEKLRMKMQFKKNDTIPEDDQW